MYFSLNFLYKIKNHNINASCNHKLLSDITVENFFDGPWPVLFSQEVWTLCRIFKRVTHHRNPTTLQPNRRPVITLTDSCSKTSSLDSDHTSHHVVESLSHKLHEPQRQPQTQNPYWNQLTTVGFNQPTYTCHDNNLVNLWNINGEDFIGEPASWDELRSVIDGNTNHL